MYDNINSLLLYYRFLVNKSCVCKHRAHGTRAAKTNIKKR